MTHVSRTLQPQAPAWGPWWLQQVWDLNWAGTTWAQPGPAGPGHTPWPGREEPPASSLWAWLSALWRRGARLLPGLAPHGDGAPGLGHLVPFSRKPGCDSAPRRPRGNLTPRAASLVSQEVGQAGPGSCLQQLRQTGPSGSAGPGWRNRLSLQALGRPPSLGPTSSPNPG